MKDSLREFTSKGLQAYAGTSERLSVLSSAKDPVRLYHVLVQLFALEQLIV